MGLRTRQPVIFMIIMLLLPMFMVLPGTVSAQSNTWTIDNGFIQIEIDKDRGGAVSNIKAICDSFKGTPVYENGIGGSRGGGWQPATRMVLWDLISNNNPWYGAAVTTPADVEIVEETDNYTIFQVTYALTEDPFNGLKVVKTFKLYRDTFWMDFNMTLENTGSSSISIDLSQAWGRPIGLGLEMVGTYGQDSGNDGQFIIYTDGTFEHYIQGSSWSGGMPGGPVNVNGQALAIGMIDNTTDPSPWGWVTILMMADQETISKTSYVWFETGPGGLPSSLIRIEFLPVTLDPSQKEEYHMKLYSGPIVQMFLSKFGVSNDIISRMMSDELSQSVPCIKITYELKYPINIKINTVGGKALPDNTIYVYDADTGTFLTQVSLGNLSSYEFQLKLPFKTPHRYKLQLAKLDGLTADGRGRFTFENWVLPNGSRPTDLEIIAVLQEGDTLTLNFTITMIARFTILFVGSDGESELDALAGNITFKIVDELGVEKYKSTSIGIVLGASVTAKREFENIMLEVPGSYRLILPLKSTGGFTFQKVYLNGTELPSTIQGETVKVTLDLNEPGVYTLKIVYSTGGVGGGAGGGILVWIAVAVVLVVIAVIAVIMRKRKQT